jgi:putative tricarboxylic transport membrane protein
VQGWTIGDALGDLPGQFFGRPLSLAIIAMICLSFIYPFLPQIRRMLGSGPREAPGPRAPRPAILRDVVTFAVFAGIGVVALIECARLNPEAAVFPRTIAQGMLVLIVLAVIQLARTRRVTEDRSPGSWPRRIAVPVVMIAGVALLPLAGFEVAGLAMGLALIVPALHERPSNPALVRLVAGVGVTIVLFTLAFRELLGVPLPSAALW